MPRQKLDVGDFPKDMSAEQLWTALKKSEENFAELYKLLGLVNMQKYVQKAGDTLFGPLTVPRLVFSQPGAIEFTGLGDVQPKETAAHGGWTVYGVDRLSILNVPYDGVSPATLHGGEILHTGNGGGQVEDVPVYSSVKILAVKPFRELYAELDRNVSVTLTLPEDADADFAPTVMFHTLHRGAGWKLSFTQGVRYYGGAAPTQVTADGTLTTWMFHYFKGIWTVAYNIAR